ncbi:mitochondrial fission factor-like isoform X1 [Xiphias gladius]|uniref:mitochondrial fission factor-like isoform X1 n=1 Tax=Xiphias gladius TaxID=8245 RepID=UPI001A99ED90|nr:mitochondrial fission factor-like isoform X1 [Xiphias gladius]
MMMAFTLCPKEMSQAPSHDPALVEIINKNMHVPERLSVGPRQQWQGEEGEEAMRWPEELPPAYTMEVPDRLTYTEVPDMSPRPLFSPSRPTICSPLGLEPCWQSPPGEVYREALQSPIRRSYSDQSFGRTPPGTPTQLKQALALPRHTSSSTMENWSPEEEGGAAVEFLILRRQLKKMSRRLAVLERHNAERRNTGVVLFSLLFSACLLNAWLWIRR